MPMVLLTIVLLMGVIMKVISMVFRPKFPSFFKISYRWQSLKASISEQQSVTTFDFDKEDFSIPIRSHALYLELTNKHEMDDNISFEEKSHTYKVNGVPTKYSVTQIVESYFPKFESKAMANKMTKSNNWPRDGYIHENGTPFTVNEILEKWRLNGLQSRNRGSLMHYYIEGFLNHVNDSHMFTLPELSQFHSFYTNQVERSQSSAYRTEWRIAAEELSLAGSVDYVGKLPDGTYEIIDWKRAKDLKNNLVNRYERAK